MQNIPDNMTVFSHTAEDKDALRRMLDDAIDAIFAAVRDDAAFSGISPYELRRMIAELGFLPDAGDGWDRTLESLKETILPNMLCTWSQSYMPHLHSPALLESIAAELVISVYNNSMDSWDQSPAATELEVSMINGLCRLFGYGDGSDGTFTSGGSQSNMSAAIAFRDLYLERNLGWDVKKKGLPPQAMKLRMYTSEIAHFSFQKSAHIMGLGYDSVVLLPIDDNARIDIAKAEDIIRRDRDSGYLPFLIVATAGTTDFGSIDDVSGLRSIADRYGCFLHVDAAYGSGAIMSRMYRDRLGDISLADSITMDFHKMFLLSISCSAVIFRDRSALDCFLIHADYLNREEDEEDGYINLVGKSMQTTRRSDALKVYISFRMRGREGFAAIVDKAIGNAEYFYSRLISDDAFIAPVRPELSSVVFAHKGGDDVNRRVRRTLLSQGVVIGQTVYKGMVMLKFTLLNPKLTYEHIDTLISRIKQLAAQ